jgi:hypothetical protein
MLAPDMTVTLRPGETAIVGYGSLLSRASAEKTLGRPYDGFFGACHVEGWRRSWDIGMPNRTFYYVSGGQRIYPEKIVYLNVRPDPGALLNVVLFVVNGRELAAMHEREWIYEPRVSTSSLRGVRVEGGDAVMYVARSDYRLTGVTNPANAAVRGSYLRIVEEGLCGMGEAFREEYGRTTDAVPQSLVVDDVLDLERQRIVPQR